MSRTEGWSGSVQRGSPLEGAFACGGSGAAGGSLEDFCPHMPEEALLTELEGALQQATAMLP